MWFRQMDAVSFDAVAYLSRDSERASAFVRVIRVSSGAKPFARDLDQIRWADAGDQGKAASVSQWRKGAGSRSKSAIGSPERRFRRKLDWPRFRLISRLPDQKQDRAPSPVWFRPSPQSEGSGVTDLTVGLRAKACPAAEWEPLLER